MITTALIAFAPVLLAAVSAVVYWDARRMDVSWPPMWAALIFSTGTLALGLYLFVPMVPVPGLLVIVLVGPVFYLFERDDAVHGDEPADPHTLADADSTRTGPNGSGEPASRENALPASENSDDDTAPKR